MQQIIDHPWYTALAVVAAIVVAYVLRLVLVIGYFVIKCAIDERRLDQKLQRAGRVITWEQAKQKLMSNQGSIVVETHPNGFGRAWWFETDLRVFHDCKLPTITELLSDPKRQSWLKGTSDWSDQYLGALIQSAHLVKLGSVSLFREPQEVLERVRLF